jgi:hypothetical protein
LEVFTSPCVLIGRTQTKLEPKEKKKRLKVSARWPLRETEAGTKTTPAEKKMGKDENFKDFHKEVHARSTTILITLGGDHKDWSAAKADCEALDDEVHAARFGPRTDEGGDLPRYNTLEWETLSGYLAGVSAVMVLAQDSESYWADIHRDAED